jgi:hypothetical protein
VQIERLSYFGWVWEPHQAANVSVPTKADKAELDLSLWAVGGDNVQMKEHRAAIFKLLFRCWMRRLYLEAVNWLNTKGLSNNEMNRAALNDALTHALNASWWEWLDGSRLFFGQLCGKLKPVMVPKLFINTPSLHRVLSIVHLLFGKSG